MKRSLFLLASLALTSALYAQPGASFTREQILDIFEQYNPSVLQKAAEQPDYQVVLEEFLASFQVPATSENKWEMIAAARNVENSLRLQSLTRQYQQQVTWAAMSGVASDGMEKQFRTGLQEVMTDIWAVSLQTQQAQLDELKQTLKTLRRSKDSSAEQLAALQAQIKARQAEVRSLKKNAGALILSNVNAYQEQVDRQLAQSFASGFAAARAQELSAAQADNLQIKTNHKNPVAE